MTALRYDDGYEPLPTIHPDVLAAEQIIAADLHMDRHPNTLVRWPYPELDAMTGPMGQGEVWFVCAFSGGGKTSFVTSTIDCWRRAGKRVFAMPLELQPSRFRTYLACMETGTPPGDALSGQLRADPTRDGERAALKAALGRQIHPGYVDRVMVSEQRAINVRGLERGLMEAAAFKADVVIVDHIDHIEGDAKTSGYQASKDVNHAALRMAQDNGLLLVFTSQLNMQIAGGPDKLAKYQPPQVQHVQFPSVKLQVATGMIGLYRPLRGRQPAEDPKAYAEALRLARAGEVEPSQALAHGIMGVNAMKLRNYGHHEGRRVSLGFERGRVLGPGMPR